MTGQIEIEVLQSINEIDAAQWDRLVRDSDPALSQGKPGRINPFMRHAFLAALENSGSATARTGWQARHLLVRRDGVPVGAVPCYAKSHSQGEYVFDHGWADAFERAGGRYYPKLQCSVPFTPATGPRLLAAAGSGRDDIRRALLSALASLASSNDISSAHITFLPQEEAEFASGAGFLVRNDRQFHWYNAGYENFDAFLASLSARKRKNIKRERRTAISAGIAIDHLTGCDLTEDIWDQFFRFYMDTGSRKWGRPYLNRKFYSLIGETMAEDIVLIMARRGGKYIAGAINFLGADCLYGRHWGCIEDHDCLHFEVCYYQAIDHAIASGLARVEAGAQGSHKIARGYLPVTTWSAHWITNAHFRSAVEDFLKRERHHIAEEREFLAMHAPYRKSE